MPVEAEFGQQLAGKLVVDVGHAQNVEHGLVGLPVGRNLARLGVEFNGVGVVRPLAAHMFDKAGIPAAVAVAALAPVEHELRYRVFDKTAINVGALQDFQRVVTGLPVRSNGSGLGKLLLVVLVLLPALGHMLGKGAVPGGAGVAFFAPVADKFGHQRLDKSGLNTVELGQVIDAFPVGAPVAVDRACAAVVAVESRSSGWRRWLGGAAGRGGFWLARLAGIETKANIAHIAVQRTAQRQHALRLQLQQNFLDFRLLPERQQLLQLGFIDKLPAFFAALQLRPLRQQLQHNGFVQAKRGGEGGRDNKRAFNHSGRLIIWEVSRLLYGQACARAKRDLTGA
ncbi:MAG: hypothetical protein CMN84_00805 [Spongiibacteraceae bacterium]|nr:hypothetical protein [Spongiibacteraceae bacterium]